jgi:phospholipase C
MKISSSFFSRPHTVAGVDRHRRRMVHDAEMALRRGGERCEEAVFQEKENTHLWIVNRAAELLRDEGKVGALAYELVKPGSGKMGDEFHDNLCRGIYDPDRKAPYTDPLLPFGLCPTWKSHFYDPDTQTNWLGQKTPTAVTRTTSCYHLAREAYQLNERRLAGYLLGLALHFMGDLTQPMHAANFTWLSSWPCGYHTAFEEYARIMLLHIEAPVRFQPLALGVMPQGYLKAVARRTKDTYYRSVCRPEWLQSYRTEEVTNEVWHQRVGFLIGPMLADAVLMTAQFLFSWAELLLPVQENKPMLLERAGEMNAIDGCRPPIAFISPALFENE